MASQEASDRKRRTGSEDPWLCVPDFGQVCLSRKSDSAPAMPDVNSGKYLNWSQSKTIFRRSATGPIADLLTQFSPTAATKGKADASWCGLSTRSPKRQPRPGAVVQIDQNVLFWIAANGSEADATALQLGTSPIAVSVELRAQIRCRGTVYLRLFSGYQVFPEIPACQLFRRQSLPNLPKTYRRRPCSGRFL